MKAILIGGPRHREELDVPDGTTTITDYDRVAGMNSRKYGGQWTEQEGYFAYRQMDRNVALDAIGRHLREEPDPAYEVRLFNLPELTIVERNQIIARFRQSLDSELGGPTQVVDLLREYEQIQATPDEKDEREVAARWRSAHNTAVTSALGPPWENMKKHAPMFRVSLPPWLPA